MGRPINEEQKRRIASAAHELFAEVGYDGTTYSAIAKRLGISRNLVQYHFPKKEMLAISYISEKIAEAQSGLGIADDGIEQNPKDALVAIGVRFFDSFLSSEGQRAFLQDIIRSRDLTEDVLAFNARWAFEHLGVEPDEIVELRATRSVIVHMGGFYELLYHCLKTGENMSINEELAEVVDAFLSEVS